jgi:hypothetical protein
LEQVIPRLRTEGRRFRTAGAALGVPAARHAPELSPASEVTEPLGPRAWDESDEVTKPFHVG